jgi:multiple sugar transport system permease protein
MARDGTRSSPPTLPALASSDRPLEPADSTGVLTTRRARLSLGAWRSDGAARWIFIWPAVLFVLFLSVFPFLASLGLSFSRLVFVKGRIDIRFVGLDNYLQLLVGTERSHLLGVTGSLTPVGWLVLGVGVALLASWLVRAYRGFRAGRLRLGGVLGRIAMAVVLGGLLWLVVATTAATGGRPGALVVTLVYVFVGIAIKYLLGLGLAMLAVQPVRGRRLFRVVCLLPLMITPVGLGYMFRMMTDTSKGPLGPVFGALGLQGATWVTDPWLARVAVLIGDAWQWTPFVFIVLLAALESLDQEVREAAFVDGAGRWSIFQHITMPAILPVSITVVLILMIEGFKIVDMPNILTGGGPGTATQSLTLQAYLDWRTLNLGRSAAVAYLLLLLVTILATAYVSWVRRSDVPRVAQVR